MRLLIPFLSCVLLSSAAAQDAGVEGVFSLGVGARALALGRAFTSVADDPTSIYWNPSSLPLLPQKQLSSLHIPLYLSSAYDFFGFAVPTRTLGGFGMGAMNVRTGDIEGRDRDNVSTGDFNYSETEYLLSYGGMVPRIPLVSRVLTPLYAGVTMKLVHQSLGGSSALGAGGDIGFLYTPTALRGLRLGLSFQNVLQPTLKLRQTSDRLPLSVRGGVSLSSSLGDVGQGLVTIDVHKATSRSMKYCVGAEFNVRRLFSVRAGWDGDPALGFGVTYWKLGFDYAYVSREPGPLHCVSVGFRIGRTIAEDWIAVKRREAEERTRRAEAERKAMIEKHSAIAVELYRKEDYFGALGEWQKVLAFDPENSDAERWVGQITDKIQSIQEDVIKDQELLALIKEQIDSGIEFLTKGNYDGAITQWNKVLSLDPTNATAREYLEKTRTLLAGEISEHSTTALQLEREEKFVEALSKWKEVLELDPQNSAGLAGVERVSKRIEEAQHINLGFEYFTAGEFDKSAIEFRAALALNPENKTAVEYLRRSVGRKSLLEISGDKEVWRLYLKGIEHFTRGEYEEAIRVWEEVLELDPENENAVRNIEEAKLRLKKASER
ncbi:hypothetical protein AMJ40_06870 [candidate division TA06 bacterium DG_26]|uniref:PorV/PorQ family protein n=1 Tax=candidate division TA06 bacterium DG_26 TaxID=1703771 RepID=A0A0S7WF74_UNCT6|nr:MAG: hypothetical protein AMJ40_06870 [candidate division TA06 bacterium DG_26]